jgi:RNA polymerase sigma factor (TIGR02999 family)
MDDSHLVMGLLKAWSDGEEESLDRLLPIVEGELRRIAHRYMRRETNQITLQTSALVNEAYLKLIKQRDVKWENREHFFALAARIMRRILLNHARDRVAQKRGGNLPHVSLEEVNVLSAEKSLELVALDEALARLAEFDKLKSRIIEMRYFGGLTVDETAKVLGIAPATVAVHWRVAKAWLAKEIRGEKKRL